MSLRKEQLTVQKWKLGKINFDVFLFGNGNEEFLNFFFFFFFWEKCQGNFFKKNIRASNDSDREKNSFEWNKIS